MDAIGVPPGNPEITRPGSTSGQNDGIMAGSDVFDVDVDTNMGVGNKCLD